MKDWNLRLKNETEVWTGQAPFLVEPIEGEVVFTTGMAGYPEVLTDPSYFGQVVVFTFPLIGNYGVPDPQEWEKYFESRRSWVRGVVVNETTEQFSHCQACSSLSRWLESQNIPLLTGVDTRQLTRLLRETGTTWGRLAPTSDQNSLGQDPLMGRYVPEVSPKEITVLEPPNFRGKTLAFLDCGAKESIFRHFLARGVRVLRLPFDQDPWEQKKSFDGLFISNGPGDPSTLKETIEITKKALEKKDLPIFGICLGNQILALAAGAKTQKMRYGHRGVNQPAMESGTKRCLMTAQNHGYEVVGSSLPQDFEVWWSNLNDDSVEGLRRTNGMVSSVQFHPEAAAGPQDAEYLFDQFVERL